MARGNYMTVVGNLTRDPELRFTKSEMPVTNLGVAWNQSKRVGDEWENTPHFIDVTCFKQLAEHVAESLSKGDRVIIEGRFDFQSWEDKETGKNRSKIVLLADSVGADLTYATAELTKVGGNGGGGLDSATEKAAASFTADEEPF